MSSDWLNLFVHQGREFIDSVSRRGIGKDDVSSSNNTSGSPTLLNSTAEAQHRLYDDMENEDVLKNRTENESETPEDGKEKSEKPVTGAEKGIYETQLEQLQEQLVDIMIENQEMATELNSLRESDAAKLSKELEKEQSKRRQLEEKLRKIKEEDRTPKLRRRRKADKSKSSVDNEQDSEMDTNKTEDILSTVNVETISNGGQEGRLKQMRSWVTSWYKSLSERITLMVWNIISDLTDEETHLDLEDVDGPPLAVKTLKENINRFRSGLRPITEFVKKVNWVLSWSNPAATMLIFLVYIFSFWHGHTISLVIFLAIVQLSANFAYSKFGSNYVKDDVETPVENSAGLVDKFQVVLHVARKVQNYLGSLSDHLEKIKNLLMWEVPRVTVRLYIVLWMVLMMSLALNGPQFFTLSGMFLGYKLFVINPLYRRFPKLRKRHDITLKLWNELPVDSEPVVERKIHEFEESQVSVQSHSEGQATVLPEAEAFVLCSKLFCERYKLTSDEIIVKGWEEGWRTSLMNKLKPLTNIKHGRLYLTQNYLCFERSQTNIEKNILLKLSDIRCVNKYKPLQILPGTGMSIEVYVKEKDEPYIFAAIYGRDDAYNDIVKEGKKAGLPWAT